MPKKSTTSTSKPPRVQRPLSLSRDDLARRGRITNAQSLLRHRNIERVMGLLAIVLITLGTIWLVATGNVGTRSYGQNDKTVALNPVVQMLANHPVSALAGGYLQIHSVQAAYDRKMYLRPTAGCGTIQSPATHGFRAVSYAYLYSGNVLSGGVGGCTLAQVIKEHGRPTRQIAVASAQDSHSIVMLFYDQPHRVFIPKRISKTVAPPVAVIAPAPSPAPAPVIPLTLQNLPDTQCPTTSIMNVVAHEDDDLLFMNPDTLHDIQAGNCVRSVYLTAGDDGQSSYYWHSREKGAEAAYGTMLGVGVTWQQHRVDIGNGDHVTVASPYGHGRISLIFFELPDGNLDGSGFPSTGGASLVKLQTGVIPNLVSLDGQSSYTSAQLTTALANLFNTYQPSIVRTQADDSNADVADHSDHIVTGQYAAAALAASASVGATLAYYQGYPIRVLPTNISDSDAAAKAAAFFAYARYDAETCTSLVNCDADDSAYSLYISRQYTQ